MHVPRWIWQQPQWPAFTWQAEQLGELLRQCAHAQGLLQRLAGGGRSTRYQLVGH